MFSSIQSVPGLVFARSECKSENLPGVEARLRERTLQRVFNLSSYVHATLTLALIEKYLGLVLKQLLAKGPSGFRIADTIN